MNILSSLLSYIGDQISSIRDTFTSIQNTISPIGTVATGSATVNINSSNIDTYTTGASASLAKGTWVIVGTFDFQPASTSGARNCNIVITSGTGSILTGQRVFMADNAFHRLQVTHIRQISSTTETIYVKASSNKTISGDCSTTIRAVRIK